MADHRIGTRQERLAERRELLDAERGHMRQGDELAGQRQQLPWVLIQQEYMFETDNGKGTLAELFEGRPRSASVRGQDPRPGGTATTGTSWHRTPSSAALRLTRSAAHSRAPSPPAQCGVTSWLTEKLAPWGC